MWHKFKKSVKSGTAETQNKSSNLDVFFYIWDV